MAVYSHTQPAQAAAAQVGLSAVRFHHLSFVTHLNKMCKLFSDKSLNIFVILPPSSPTMAPSKATKAANAKKVEDKKGVKAAAQREPRYEKAGEEILVNIDPEDFLVEDGDEGGVDPEGVNKSSSDREINADDEGKARGKRQSRRRSRSKSKKGKKEKRKRHARYSSSSSEDHWRKRSRRRRDISSLSSSSSSLSSSASSDSEWEGYFSHATVAKVREVLKAGTPRPPRKVLKRRGRVAFNDLGEVLFVGRPSGKKEKWMKEMKAEKSER
jgi:hypothetical protein